jgi:hypothetical protein
MLFLLALGGTIAFFHLSCTLSDDIFRMLAGLISQLCLLLSLIYAPWIVNLAAVIAIVSLLPGYRRNAL